MIVQMRHELAKQGVPPAHLERMCVEVLAGKHDHAIRQLIDTTSEDKTMATQASGSDHVALHRHQIDAFKEQQKQRMRYITTWASKPIPKKPAQQVVRDCETRPKVPVPDQDNSSIFLITMTEPYPPCIEGPRHLKPVTLAQLRTESHHHGKVLLVKLTDLYTVGRSAFYTVIRDVDGGYESVRVPTFCMSYDRSWPEKDAWIAIKEPYLTIDGSMNQTFVVTRPSDIVFIDRVPQAMRPLRLLLSGKETSPSDALHCKEIGRNQLKGLDFAAALTSYSQGLKLLESGSEKTANPEALRRDLCRNCSLANLDLRRYNEALADALAAVTPPNEATQPAQDVRAYSRAGCAAYSLRLFEQAMDLFSK